MAIFLSNNKSVKEIVDFLEKPIPLRLVYIYILSIYLISLFFNRINPDAGTYLSAINRIFEGYVPMRDYREGYAPVALYIMCLPKFIFGHFSNYITQLAFVHMISFISALLAFKLALRITQNRAFAASIGAFYLLTNFFLKGSHLLLEPFVAFFGLLALLCAHREKPHYGHVLIAGILCGLSFLCKQYGLLFLPVIGLLLFYQKPCLKAIGLQLMLVLGFLLPIAALLYYFYNEIGSWSFLSLYSGKGYGNKSIAFLAFALSNYALLLLLPFLFTRCKIGFKTLTSSKFLPYLIGIFLGCFQFYFKYFLHYHINILPLLVVIFCLGYCYINARLCVRYVNLILYVSTISTLVIAFNIIYVQYPARKEVQAASQKTLALVGAKDCTYFTNAYQTYYFTDLKPALLKEYGYGFLENHSDSIIQYKMSQSNVFLFYKDKYLNLFDSAKTTAYQLTPNYRLFIRN